MTIDAYTDAILYDVIKKEFDAIDKDTRNIKLKSIRSRRRSSLVFLGFGVLLFFFLFAANFPDGSGFFGFVGMACVVFGIGLFGKNDKTAKVRMIALRAKENPDTPISEIIRGEIIE